MPVTAFVPGILSLKVRPTFEITNIMANVEVRPGYQTAQVENAPDTATGFDSTTYNSVSVFYLNGADVSSATVNKRLVRFGFFIKKTAASGTSLGIVRLGGLFEYGS